MRVGLDTCLMGGMSGTSWAKRSVPLRCLPTCKSSALHGSLPETVMFLILRWQRGLPEDTWNCRKKGNWKDKLCGFTCVFSEKEREVTRGAKSV